jgi:two-component system, NarL family, response regulator DesR
VIRVLLSEDQGTVRGALAALLRLEADLEVVAEVERGTIMSGRWRDSYYL